MWFTSKAQMLIIFVLLGLYSWNSFAGVLSLHAEKSEQSYSASQLILLAERLQAVEGDEFQTEVGSSLNEIASSLKDQNLAISLDALFTRAGNTPIVFNEKFHKFVGNNFVYYKNYFQAPNHINFKLSFLNYYFENYNEFTHDNNRSSSLLEYEELTYKTLEKLIIRDLHLAINDAINELLDRNGEFGEQKVVISKEIVKKSLGLSDKKQYITLAQFLDPYLFEMERHLLKRDILNKNNHFVHLRGLIGEFNNDQFFRLIFKDEKSGNQLPFKNLFSSLREKIKIEFPHFKDTILKQRLNYEGLNSSVLDYIKSPKNEFKSSLIVSSLLCGLNENIKAQAFGGNMNIKNYCHYNSLYSAFTYAKESKKVISENLVYPNIGTLLERERKISSEIFNP